MADAKFTPGPWRPCTGSHKDSCICGLVFAGDAFIAAAKVDRCPVQDHGECAPPDETSKANARLIAAAPLGYEIATEILRACDRGTGREISDVTRQEIEPLRKLAEQFMAALG